VSATAPQAFPYAIDGWGVGEVWFEGQRLVWHELPSPHRSTRAHARTRVTPTLGGANDPPPLRSTIPAKRALPGDVLASQAEQFVHTIQSYFAGSRTVFEDVELEVEGWTPFQLAILRVLRRVPYGEVVSYSDLARLAGYPRAQRAAGTFCAHNRFALVVPCHRVVGSNGPGSYGSLGLQYKRRLLALEGVTV
jgi:methylated-DNA-[protein]-cysteine S-methyltransferase